MVASVIGTTKAEGGTAGEIRAMSSPVLMMEVSIWNVAFSDSVKSLVKAGADSNHGSGGWYVMAMTVNISTEKTKREKQRLLMSLIRFCPMGSVVRSGSLMEGFKWAGQSDLALTT